MDYSIEPTNTINIPIKHLLLEGTTTEEILEMAVHSNHPHLDKRILATKEKLRNSVYFNKEKEQITDISKKIATNRSELADSIRENRKLRDKASSNLTGIPSMVESYNMNNSRLNDNIARAKSRFGLAELGRPDSKIPTDVLMNSVVKVNPNNQPNIDEFQNNDSFKLYNHGLIKRNISSAKH